jgi:hypothetical protein
MRRLLLCAYAKVCAQHSAACCTLCLRPCSRYISPSCSPLVQQFGLEAAASQPVVWHQQWFLVVQDGYFDAAGPWSSWLQPVPYCGGVSAPCLSLFCAQLWQWSWCPAVGALGWVATVTICGTTLCSVTVQSPATVCACVL